MFNYLIALITGFLVKTVDSYADEKLRIQKTAVIIISVVYGALIAYLVGVLGILPELWLGIIIGLLFAGKIDNTFHYLGIGSLIFFLSIFGIAKTNLLLLILFTTLCYLEEYLHDYYSKKKRKNMLSKIFRLRPLLEISALISSIIMNNFAIFFLLLSFDFGYYLSKYSLQNKYYY